MAIIIPINCRPRDSKNCKNILSNYGGGRGRFCFSIAGIVIICTTTGLGNSCFPPRPPTSQHFVQLFNSKVFGASHAKPQKQPFFSSKVTGQWSQSQQHFLQCDYMSRSSKFITISWPSLALLFELKKFFSSCLFLRPSRTRRTNGIDFVWTNSGRIK